MGTRRKARQQAKQPLKQGLTVGELRALLGTYPDNMPVAVDDSEWDVLPARGVRLDPATGPVIITE